MMNTHGLGDVEVFPGKFMDSDDLEEQFLQPNQFHLLLQDFWILLLFQ